ncbi:mast cell protease 1A-like [Melanotaenia boesemani]|uniref:mast cell protease 1A-like n=1 Tax=Melanotaenia boesemani TaxID=1250792 RepID=UPI001C0565F0|nr:mast cell protease 1A-like [Melanotaenia boesemani]
MYGLRAFLLFYVLTCVGQTVHGGKIIHGQKAPKNSLQYMVSVQDDEGHVCGGFLITPDFVMTAAHCGEIKLTHVILGTHNIKRNNYVKREIEMTYMHPKYNPKKIKCDIMLLKLAVEADLNERVHTIPIPKFKKKALVNQTCSVAGWGKINPWNSGVSVLRVVNVSVIDPEFCKKEWEVLPPNVICAGGSGTYKGTCNGDSGGPLVCNGMAVGIVSFGSSSDCIYPDLPNVYTDISRYVVWINKILKDNY